MWKDLKADNNYEILDIEPYSIRNKKTKRILKGWNSVKGYISIELSGKKYQLHRVLALQFIPNDKGYDQIDHINGIKNDNRLENLRWCDSIVNNRNRNGYKGKFEIFEELPPRCYKVISYNGMTPDYNYYADDFKNIYFDNGARIRILNTYKGHKRNPRVGMYINGVFKYVNPSKLTYEY